MSQKVTLKQLAQILNVTPATISKALRDSNDISIETRKKVKALAAKMGYRPNIMARSLVSKRTFMLGVIVPNLQISFFSECARGIYERVRRYGYEAIIMVNDENAENERKNLEFLSSLAVDGILIDAVPGNANHRILKDTQKMGIPFVSYDRSLDTLGFHSVTIDDEHAAVIVIEKLVADGKKRILYLGPTSGISVLKNRYSGYQKGLEENGLGFDPDLVIPCEIDQKNAYNSIKEFIKKDIPFDAVMCVGGMIAYGAGKAILDAGYNIPNDIAITEFGDNDIVARLGVPFLTVYQYPYKIGSMAVDMMVDLIDNPVKHKKPVHKIIKSKLIYHDIGIKRKL